MWNCHKCGKPVYFAERKQSLGYDWHPECLRCEECGKRLNPGQHAEHKGVPYCHVPCYGALFGPQLFGHGTRVEAHTSFGRVENKSDVRRSHLEAKLKQFNQFYDGKSGEIRSREVNGRLVLEGALRIHWGVLGVIHLKEDDDQRTVVTIRKRNSCRGTGVFNIKTDDVDVAVDVSRVRGRAIEAESCTDSSEASTPDDSAIHLVSPGHDVTPSDAQSNSALSSASSDSGLGEGEGGGGGGGSGRACLTLPPRLDIKQIDWDELDELLQVERKTEDGEKAYRTMPAGTGVGGWPLTETPPPSPLKLSPDAEADVDPDAYSQSFEDNLEDREDVERSPSMEHEPALEEAEGEGGDGRSVAGGGGCGGVGRRRAGSTAIKRRHGGRRNRNAKLKRRCSINGHYYNRETSFFTPPFGSQMSVWLTSLVTSQEVINLLLDKYKIDSRPNAFSLFIVRDNGEQRRLSDDEYPLVARILLGPHEDVAKIYLMDGHTTDDVSFEVAQFLNLSAAECSSILDLFYAEEEREVWRVRAKYREMKSRIKRRMEELKVRL